MVIPAKLTPMRVVCAKLQLLHHVWLLLTSMLRGSRVHNGRGFKFCTRILITPDAPQALGDAGTPRQWRQRLRRNVALLSGACDGNKQLNFRLNEEDSSGAHFS